MTLHSTLIRPLETTGAMAVSLVKETGALFLFFCRGFAHIFSTPIQLRKIVRQVYFIGARSVFVICLTALFTGMVLGLQGYYTLVKFGSDGLLGAAVALSLIRELGPVMTAIMVIARAGSAMAAEIGIMRISEQIDALKTMDISPMRYLISPKFAAALISLPLLTAIFDVVGIFGGLLTASGLLGMNPSIYFSRMESSVLMQDITGGFIKSVVFGILLVVICCFQGYYTHRSRKGFGAEGVSSSTTSAVVISCVLVLISDYVMTSFLL